MSGVNQKNQQQFEQEDKLIEMKKKYNEVVLAAKHIFQVSVNCLQLLEDLNKVSKIQFESFSSRMRIPRIP